MFHGLRKGQNLSLCLPLEREKGKVKRGDIIGRPKRMKIRMQGEYRKSKRQFVKEGNWRECKKRRRKKTKERVKRENK